MKISDRFTILALALSVLDLFLGQSAGNPRVFARAQQLLVYPAQPRFSRNSGEGAAEAPAPPSTRPPMPWRLSPTKEFPRIQRVYIDSSPILS
jgi:hypothetical protein